MSDLTQTAIGKHRWVVCTLLFFATTINYIDRAVISILKPDLMTELGWNESITATRRVIDPTSSTF